MNQMPMFCLATRRPFGAAAGRVVAVLAVALFSCARGAREQSGADGGERDAGVPLERFVAPRLSPAKLDGYLAYQRQMVEVWKGTLAELDDLTAHLDAGVGNVGRLSRRRLEAEAKAREASGLSADEARAIDRLVAEVLPKRMAVRVSGLDESIAELEQLLAVKERMSPERQGKLEASLAQLRRQRAEAERLVPERLTWGDDNVDLILTKEVELTQNWEALLTVFGGRP